MAATSTFRPFVPAHESPKELSARALLLGAFFGVVFGAVTVYVGLEAGLTVAASIPISVLSISILRAFSRATILENNIVQTTGNAGQSIASGVIFTLPALIFLGFDLESFRIFALALLGGWLGVLFMIPLRRQLVVEEHGTLTYPEGTACADVLQAGERRVVCRQGFSGTRAGRGIYAVPERQLAEAVSGDSGLSAQLRPARAANYEGLGDTGRRDAGVSGRGVHHRGEGVGGHARGRWLVLMPAIMFFGKHLPGPIYPGVVPISQMSPSDLWTTYVRPMGAGAVAASGLITLLRTAPTIIGALTAGFGEMGKGRKRAAAELAPRPDFEPLDEPSLSIANPLVAEVSGEIAALTQPPSRSRTERDIPMSAVVGGSVLLVLLMFLFLEFKPVPGAQVTWLANLAAALLVMVFGFLFVTVSSRIVGIVGSSANPVSGMTIATLMATSAIFLVKGWTAPAFGALAITVGGMVCIASSNAGDTSQDLKTGYLIGATPWKQQVAVMIGVMVSMFVIGPVLSGMNIAFESFQTLQTPRTMSLAQLPSGVTDQGQFTRDSFTLTPHSLATAEQEGQGQGQQVGNARQLVVLNSIGSSMLQDGKYLYSPATGQIDYEWIQGIGSERAAAPQGRLMATVINGILSRKLPWSLVLLGVALVIGIELLGVRSLTFAVGAYLSISTTLAIFCGGAIRWAVDYAAARDGQEEASPMESEISSGSLLASGLIAAGGVMGLLGVALKVYEGYFHRTVFQFATSNLFYKDWVSVVAFVLLGYSLYYFARKPLGSEKAPDGVEPEV